MKTKKKDNDTPTFKTQIICVLSLLLPFLADWLVGKLSYAEAIKIFVSRTGLWRENGWFRMRIFKRLIQTCEDAGQAKGIFYAAPLSLEAEFHFRSNAVEKWLTFLTDYNQPKQERDVRNLLTEWVHKDWSCYAACLEKAREFAKKLSQDIKDKNRAFSVIHWGETLKDDSLSAIGLAAFNRLPFNDPK